MTEQERDALLVQLRADVHDHGAKLASIEQKVDRIEQKLDMGIAKALVLLRDIRSKTTGGRNA